MDQQTHSLCHLEISMIGQSRRGNDERVCLDDEWVCQDDEWVCQDDKKGNEDNELVYVSVAMCMYQS